MRKRGRGGGRGGRTGVLPAAVALLALLALGGGAVAYGASADGAAGPPRDRPPADSVDLGMRQYDYTFAPTAAGAAPITRLVPVTLGSADTGGASLPATGSGDTPLIVALAAAGVLAGGAVLFALRGRRAR